MRIIRPGETDSTLNYLRRLSCNRKLEEFTTVISPYQTAGRGQRTNRWESEPGKNLLFSFLLYPSFLKANAQFILSQMTAVSIREELSNYSGEITIKWPNDIYWKDKKIAGILIENDITGSSISTSIHGAGINLNQRTFSPMPLNPVSLREITGQEYDPEKLLTGIMERIIFYYPFIKAGDYQPLVSSYMETLYRKEGIYEYEDREGRFQASLEGVSPGGNLLLKRVSGEIRSYGFKEVKFLL